MRRTGRPRLPYLLLLLLLLLRVGLGLSPARGEERPPFRLLIVQSRTLAVYQQLIDGLQRSLKKAGVKAVLEVVSLEGDAGSLALVKTRLSGTAPPDLLIPLGTVATRALVALHAPPPLLFAMVLNPASSGLPAPGLSSADSPHPTGSPAPPLTGISMDIPPEQSLDALLDAYPQARSIGVLMGPAQSGTDAAVPSSTGTDPTNLSPRARLEKEASRHGSQLRFQAVSGERALPGALEALLASTDAILALPDATLYSESSLQFMLLQSLRQSRPLGGVLEPITRAGALVSADLDYDDLGQQTAVLAMRILRGEAAATLPVELPRTFKCLVNLRTARRLGLNVPPEVLRRAEVVVP